jgi:hypothetical protein
LHQTHAIMRALTAVLGWGWWQFELLKSFFEGIVAATAIDHRDAARERTAKTFSASRMFKGTKLVVKPTVKHVLDRPKQTMHNLMDIVAGECLTPPTHPLPRLASPVLESTGEGCGVYGDAGEVELGMDHLVKQRTDLWRGVLYEKGGVAVCVVGCEKVAASSSYRGGRVFPA